MVHSAFIQYLNKTITQHRSDSDYLSSQATCLQVDYKKGVGKSPVFFRLHGLVANPETVLLSAQLLCQSTIALSKQSCCKLCDLQNTDDMLIDIYC